MSFDSNTGNVNWQRQFRQDTTFFNSTLLVSTTVNSNDLYVTSFNNSSTIGTNGFAIKVPADGSIPGSGTYSGNLRLVGNLIYSSMNASISNANLTISNANLLLSNAIVTSVIDPNITANTTPLYTFNSVRLI
jgi:hypothetical protein